MKVIHIDFPPRRDSSGKLSVATTYGVYKDTITPSAESTDAPSSQAIANRERIPPPLTPFNFLPEEQPDYAPRTDLKPLHILQPEGVSFKMDGNELEWQKWKMHVGEWTGVFHLANVSFTSSVPPSRGYRTVYHHLQR